MVLFKASFVLWVIRGKRPLVPGVTALRKDKFSVFPPDSVTANPKTQNNIYAFWIGLAGVELQIDGTLFFKHCSCRVIV